MLHPPHPAGGVPISPPPSLPDMSAKLDMQFVADGRGDLQATFGPEDVFDYLYAVFHSPTYRLRYAEFLKIDFPRLPLTTDADLFRELCGLGKRLVALHVMETSSTINREATALPSYPVAGNNMVGEDRVSRAAEGHEGRGDACRRPTLGRAGSPTLGEPGASTSTGSNISRACRRTCGNFMSAATRSATSGSRIAKDGRLSYEDISHYRRVVAALAETITLMEQIDAAIEEHGGWPLR